VNIPATVFLAGLANVIINLPEATNSLYIPAAAIKKTMVRNVSGLYKMGRHILRR